MNIVRTGIILCTQNYDECVRFYGDTLGLPVEEILDNAHSKLTRFDFGGAYLMIETGGVASDPPKAPSQNPVWLRFNVDDVDTAAAVLKAKGVSVRVRKEVWGTVGDFYDPDGNVCSFRQVPSEGGAA